MSRDLRAVAVALATVCIWAPAAAAAPQLPLRPAGATGPLLDERLSDERTLTRFARTERRATVRSRPDYDARAVTRLRWFTEDFYLETYVALQSRIVDGRPWIQIRLPKRPNGQKGWVPRWALGKFRIVRTRLEVDRSTLRARLYDRGKLVWQSRVGVGKPGTETPAGHYWIRERIRFRDAGGIYGPWAFGTAAYSRLSDWPRGGVVGVHGTNAPGLLPGRVSHGCIRVPNDKIRTLARLMPVGTPLVIT